jgi:hypothetical protein
MSAPVEATASSAARPRLGILLLEGRMAEVPGCMAAAESFPYPVRYRVVPGSRPPRSAADVEALAPRYVAAARALAAEGVDVVSENCNGLMVLLQERLAAAAGVPVVTSALLFAPEILRLLPGRRLGILAFDAAAVTPGVLAACGLAAAPIAVGEVARSAAWQEFLRTKEIPAALRPRLEADLVAVGRSMVEEWPDIGAFVGECTLLPPCSQALRDALGLPVYDILTVLDLAVAGRFRPAAMPPAATG